MRVLKTLLKEHDLVQADLARHLDLSDSAVSQLLNHGIWPRRTNRTDLVHSISDFLEKRGIRIPSTLFIEKPAGGTPQASTTTEESTPSIKEHVDMLIQKQTMKQSTLQHFGLVRNPFADPESASEVFISPDIRYVRETLHQATIRPEFLAVIGESGSGKSTIRRELKARHSDNPDVVFIEPHVLAMEKNDLEGKTLKSSHIVDAIMEKLAPGQKVFRTAEARFRQVHKALCESHRLKKRHILIIEEAHSLPTPTLRHLKRFLELEPDSGFGRMLSIILIGQTEFAKRFTISNYQIREVVQRCGVVTLPPLDDNLPAYLEHRFVQVGKKTSDIMDQSALDELLYSMSDQRNRNGFSSLYPLAINNRLIAAMNAAAEVGAPIITGDIIKGV